MAGGVGGPFVFYVARLRRLAPWLWPLPPGGPTRVGAAARCALLPLVGVGALMAWLYRAPEKRRSLRRAVDVALGLAFIAALYFFRNAWGPTGDGTWAWIRLASSPFIMGSEPLGRWTHYLFFHFFTHPDARLALEMASVSAGVLALVGTRLLVPGAFPRQEVWAVVLALVAVPTAILYAGYIETTPFAYAFTALYLLAALRYVRRGPRRPPWLEAILIAFGVWTHGSVCFATGAHAVLVA